MEKVFAGNDREKFDVAQFRDDDNSRKTSKFGDQDYDCKYGTIPYFYSFSFISFEIKIHKTYKIYEKSVVNIQVSSFKKGN